MIVLTVLSYSGVPTEGLSTSFDELGGSIGRADNNHLVLPDPERSISRVHAKVLFRGGHYVIVDNGSNPVTVNGTAVASGREQPLQAGDQIQIGGYLLAVSQPAQAGARAADPFADLFGDAAHGLASPAPAPTPTPWTSLPMIAPRPATPPAGAAPVPARPPVASAWADPAPDWAAPAPAQPAWAAPAAPAPSAGAIPDDWDPFGGEFGSELGSDDRSASAGALVPSPPSSRSAHALFAAPPAGAGPALGLPISAGGLDSLDDLFGLGAAPSSADPLGAAPQQALLIQPNMAGHADPLQALRQPASLAAAPAADHVSELNTPMSLPRARAAPAAAGFAAASAAAPAAFAPAAFVPAAAPASPGLPSGAIFSWDDPPRDGRVVTLPGQPRVAQPPAPPAWPDPPDLLDLLDPPDSPEPADLHGLLDLAMPPLSAASPPPLAAPARPAPPPAANPALLAALLQGLGAPGLRIDALTPELLRLVGELLRESTRGAVELLLARAALRREMRAQMTMIVARENNPLKFSPSVEVALQHLLSPPAPGFMPAAPAMRDVFDDLRAHQLGVMAGMKAALDGVLQRFDPQQLEAQLSKRSALSSLIPATRKARLWELFQQLFGQLSSEAQDDFDKLFGKAFLSAYEAQLDRLQAEPGAR